MNMKRDNDWVEREIDDVGVLCSAGFVFVMLKVAHAIFEKFKLFVSRSKKECCL